MRSLSDSRRVGSPPRRLLSILPSAFVIALFLLAACGETAAEAEPTDSLATTTTSQSTTTPTELTTTTRGVTTTTAAGPSTTTASVPDAQLEAAAAVGDIAAGEELFFQPLDGIQDSASCSTCHSLDPNNSQYAPTHAGMWKTAAGRVDGLTDVEYLRQSIVDPYAFLVEGSWPFPMPYDYADVLSDDQINNLVAFLLTH